MLCASVLLIVCISLAALSVSLSLSVNVPLFCQADQGVIRDNGCVHFTGDQEALSSLWQGLLCLVRDAEEWEKRLGGLMGAKVRDGHLEKAMKCVP